MGTRRTAPRSAVVLVAATVLVTVLAAACGRGAGSPVTSSSTSSSASPSATLPAATATVLQQRLDDWVGSGRLAGATAAVVTPSGAWAGAAGVDGAGHRLVPGSALWIASVTKTFTAAEVVLLASRGLVRLDAPLTDYVVAPFDTGGATVRQALAMRAGFPQYPTGPTAAAIGADLNRTWTADGMLATLPTGASRAGTIGGAPAYNSVNYVLLGRLVEKVTGRPLAEALRADLLDPAGLHRTWVQTDETPTAPLSVGTPPAGLRSVVDPAGPYLPSRSAASFTGAGGGMAADAADVARWGYLLYGGHVLGPALVAELEADPQPEPSVGPYALGTMVTTLDDGSRLVGHAGGGTDWPYTSILQVWTGSSPVAVAVLTPQPADFGTQLFDLVVGLRTAVTG